MKSAFSNPEVVPAQPPSKSKFPWGTVLGLGIVGVTGAVIYYNWAEIDAFFKKLLTPPTTPPAGYKWCEAEQKNIPESEWTDARCGAGAQPTTTSLEGTVIEYSTRTPVQNIEVTIVDSNGNNYGTQATGADGKFKFDNIPLGDYDVSYHGDCYEDLGPIRYSVKDLTYPPDLSAGVNKIPSETFTYLGSFNQKDYEFCVPRKVNSVDVTADLNCWYEHWANVNVALIDLQGMEHYVGQWELVCGLPWENKTERHGVTSNANSNGVPLKNLGLMRGIRIRNTRDGFAKNLTANVYFV